MQRSTFSKRLAWGAGRSTSADAATIIWRTGRSNYQAARESGGRARGTTAFVAAFAQGVAMSGGPTEKCRPTAQSGSLCAHHTTHRGYNDWIVDLVSEPV